MVRLGLVLVRVRARTFLLHPYLLYRTLTLSTTSPSSPFTAYIDANTGVKLESVGRSGGMRCVTHIQGTAIIHSSTNSFMHSSIHPLTTTLLSFDCIRLHVNNINMLIRQSRNKSYLKLYHCFITTLTSPHTSFNH